MRSGRHRLRNVITVAMAIAAATLCAQDPAPSPAPTPQPAPVQQAFTLKAASPLVLQVRDGLQTRDAGRLLAAFDTAVMPDGRRFEQQVLSFFSHTESIRVHLNLLNAGGDQQNGTAEVEAELEADLGDNTVPLHKQARLKFSAALVQGEWRFVDVEPRAFFSTQP